MKLVLEPIDWPVQFRDCRPGFFVYNKVLCLKTEYGDNEAFIQSGERFWGGTGICKEDLMELLVQPVIPKWEENEETQT